MDIQDLRIFARAAAVQNLKAVGLEFRLTAGTISKRLQALEDDLGVRLMDRTTRSMRLTQEGEIFLERAKTCLAQIELAEIEIETATEAPSGRLRVAGPACIGPFIMADIVTAFLQAHPNVSVHADFTDRAVNLQEDGFDVALVRGVLPDSALRARRLMTDDMVVVGAPQLFKRIARPRRPSDLERFTCLVHGDDWDWPFVRRGKTSNVRVSGNLRCNDYGGVCRAAIAGLGIARLPLLEARDALDEGRLIQLLPDYDTTAERAIWLVYPGGKHVLPRLRAFVDLVADTLRERH